MIFSKPQDKLTQRGITVTDEHKQQLLKVKEAYDVLSDPKRRRIYDELGLQGLKFIESPSETNPADLLKNFQVFFT
jgi:DnaJ-class molecular chaperone